MGEIYIKNISCVCVEGCLYIGYDWKFVRIVDIDKYLKIQRNKKRKKKEMQIVIRIVIIQNKYWWKKFLYYSLVILYYVFQMLEV